jgi:hypothetical protein
VEGNTKEVCERATDYWAGLSIKYSSKIIDSISCYFLSSSIMYAIIGTIRAIPIACLIKGRKFIEDKVSQSNWNNSGNYANL